MAAGTPEDIVKVRESYTGQYLKALLRRRAGGAQIRSAGGAQIKSAGGAQIKRAAMRSPKGAEDANRQSKKIKRQAAE